MIILIAACGGKMHGIAQEGNVLRVMSKCCAGYLDYEVKCQVCGGRAIPASGGMTWGEQIALHAPVENIETWVRMWTGLTVKVKVE